MKVPDVKNSAAALGGFVLVAWIVGIATLHATLGAGVTQNDLKSIRGTVLNGQKPEAGVWVIAETEHLPTPYRKIVVTDEEGRFLLPDLPQADYQLWVRGYGLKDSEPVKAQPGASNVKLDVSTAPSPQEAAKIYPANYWLSIYEPPSKEELPKEYASQDQWIAAMKLGCILCHQIGAEPTRNFTKPEEWDTAWSHAGFMNATANALGREALKKSLVDWDSRIAAGEVPATPPRPSGVERNVVVTEWQWGQWNSYIHDEVSTDKRNPTLYPYGRVYGADYGQDFIWALDPMTNRVTSYKVPTANVKPASDGGFGDWSVMNNPAHPHNPMLDDKGRVWITAAIRPATERPRWEREVVAAKSEEERAAGEKFVAEHGPSIMTSMQFEYLDTKTGKFVLADTAYGTHHLQFDSQGRLWSSGSSGGTGLGMFDPAVFDSQNPLETQERAQKFYLQLNPGTGKPIAGGGYGITVSPTDGTVWRAFPGDYSGLHVPGNKLNKFDPKAETFTDYPLPLPGRGPRGVDASTDGIIWFATGSGHLGRFNPKTEKFTYWELPGPKIKGTGAETGSAEMPYYIWVDQFDTLGLGKNMVISTGTESDALLIFDPTTDKFTVLRVPYPLSFYHRGLDGRIDDSNAGWKGRGLWADYGSDAISIYTEKTHMGSLVHIQLRPDPLAH